MLDRHRHHARAIEIVKMDWRAFKVNVRHVALPIKNATAMNVVKVAFANHYVDVTMIVAMVKCVKISFVQLDVDRMLIAQAIWLA